MGQAAYDYNAVRRRKAPQTQRKAAPLRVEQGGKRRLNPLLPSRNPRSPTNLNESKWGMSMVHSSFSFFGSCKKLEYLL